MTADLSDQIRRWCQGHQWYGAALAFHRGVGTDDPQQMHFLRPPATEAQLTEAEALLGYPLPSVLKTLYRELANGGFGPAYGLRNLDPADDESLIRQYQDRSSPTNATLSELGGECLWATPPQQIDLHYTCWPTGLVPICNWGCGAEMCLDCAAPHAPVIRVGPARHDLHLLLTGVAPSLEAWLTQWLAEEPVF